MADNFLQPEDDERKYLYKILSEQMPGLAGSC